MKNILKLPALVFSLALGFALPTVPNSALAQQENTARQSFATISSAQLTQMMEKKDFLLINVHIPYAGEIEGTDAFIPFDKITENLAALGSDKNARIVLYCLMGGMSDKAAGDLARLGYTQVSSLAGGMQAWQASGYRIIEKK